MSSSPISLSRKVLTIATPCSYGPWLATGRGTLSAPLNDRQLRRILNYDDAYAKARASLPRSLYEYVENGSEDELTLDRNRSAFRDVRFLPRQSLENPSPNISTSLFGVDVKLPVLIAPMGRTRLVHPDGDLGMARAAGRAGTIHVVASGAGYSLEEVGPEGGGPKWFQVARLISPELTEHLAERASKAGYKALVVTVDAPLGGNREASRRNGYSRDVPHAGMKNAFKMAPQLMARPGWLYRFWRDGMPSGAPNTEGFERDGKSMSVIVFSNSNSVAGHSNAPTWTEIARLRELWDGPLLIKGLLAPDDARKAEDLGANGVIVSNHGGRQLDSAPGTLDALPGIVAAVGGRLEIVLDGGIRRGSDVVKALALGARAVMVGRFAMWSLAIAGEAGLDRMFEILNTDIVRTMRLIGCTSVEDLDESWLFN